MLQELYILLSNKSSDQSSLSYQDFFGHFFASLLFVVCNLLEWHTCSVDFCNKCACLNEGENGFLS